MNYENQLAVDCVLPCLQNRIDGLSSLIQRIQKSLAQAPKGRLRLSNRGSRTHCYHVTSPEKSRGTYIPNENTTLVRRLAQKDYEQRLLQELECERTILDKAVAALAELKLNLIWMGLPDFRKKLVRPVFLPDTEFVVQWLSAEYPQKPFADEAPVLMTSRGERVRSKSEVIIADTLARLHIPYRYEFPLKLQSGKSKPVFVHPDFTCLNVRLRQEFIWEHFGMMDKPDYACKAVHKLKIYQQNNFFPGDNLILSEETTEEPLSSKTVESLAHRYLI